MKVVKEDIWMEIPGFENYEVSNIGRVRRKGGALLRYYEGKGYSLVRDHTQNYIRPPRIMYAAHHGVDPMKLKGILVIEKEGELIAMSRAEYTQLLNKKKVHPNMGEKTAKEYYRAAIEFSQMMLQYYDNKDVSPISNELLKYKESIAAYTYKNNFAMSTQTIEEAWSTVLSEILSGIYDGRISIIEPHSYLRKCIRNYFANLKRNRSSLVNFDERDGMCI